MSQSNPFGAPPAGSSQQYGYPTQSSASATTQIGRELAGTRGWVFFISILLNICGGLVAVGALFALMAGGMGFLAMGGRNAGVAAGGIMLLVVVVYGGVAAFYIAAGYWLRIYARRTTEFLRQPTTFMLEQALAAQKSFWKLVGICVVVLMAFYLLMMLVFAGLWASL